MTACLRAWRRCAPGNKAPGLRIAALPFVLLSEPELATIQAYGVWQEKKSCGKVRVGVARSSSVIDEKGYIEKVMSKVTPDTNASEIPEYLTKRP